MPQTRSRRDAAEAPRPRRRAAANRPAVVRPPPTMGTVWTDKKALDLVGTLISVYWEPEDVFYPAMVLAYLRRKNMHKIIYLEDESVEIVELGTGPEQRNWKVAEQSSDSFVGKQIVLLKTEDEEEGWFQFMRGQKEKHNPDLVVTVLCLLGEEPGEDEISHPVLEEDPDNPLQHTYYRVVYVNNDFLATVDFEQVNYKMLGDDDRDKDVKEDVKGPMAKTALPIGSRRLSSRTVTNLEDDEDAEKDDSYAPPEEVADDEDDDRQPDKTEDHVTDDDAEKSDDDVNEGKYRNRNINVSSRRRSRIDKKVTIFDDVDNDDDDGDDGDDENTQANVEVKASEMIRSLDDVDDEEGERGGGAVKPKGGEGSVATVETHDDPLEPNGTSKKVSKSKLKAPIASYPKIFEDDDDAHTASDEEKLGWVSAKKKEAPTGSRSQVGDYISLDLGDGNPVRKAFVEAYMPDADKHFLAFCDNEGGNLQVKLTEDNHTVLKDDEVDELNRAQTLDATPEAPSQTRSNKRKRYAVNLRDNKSVLKKRREMKPPPIRGERAGAEVCGRCLKIVWPGSDMVYTALVLGYDKDRDEHQVVYLSDQCVETMELKYREWNLLAKEDEPWITQGMLGKRLYVYWDGEYESEEEQKSAATIFGDDIKVAYEAYVLSYEGDGKYMIIYPNTEDKEVRDLKVDGLDDLEPKDRDWGVLPQGVMELNGLPVVGWEP